MCDIKLQVSDGKNYSDIGQNSFKNSKIQFSKDNFMFFRPKFQGSINFFNSSFQFILDSTKCCNSIPFRIQNSGSTIIDFLIEPSGFNVDYKANKVECKENSTLDFWRSIMFNWTQKINVLSFPRTEKVRHQYRNNNTYDTVINQKFYKLSDFAYYVISETLKKAKLDLLIPSSPNELSSLFTSNLLPWGGENILKNACVAQMSDFIRPLSDAATGVIEITGKINESVAIDLKTLLSNLELFEVFPFIDLNNKFRLEHRSFFESGMSYSEGVIGIDLTLSEYKDYVSNFDYSYEPNYSEIFGKKSIVLSKNESINSDSNAFPFYTMDSLQSEFLTYFNVPKIDYISKSTQLFDIDCALRDEYNEIKESSVDYDLFTTHYWGASIDCESNDENSWILLDCSEKDVNSVRDVNSYSKYGLNVVNGKMSAEYILENFHKHNRPGSSFKIIDLTFFSKSSIKKKKMRTFKLPSKFLSKINGGLNKLPDGREFIIDTFYLNLQDNFIYIDGSYDDYCVTNEALGQNGCPIKDTLLFSVNVPEFYFNQSTGLIDVRYVSNNTYADGNCGYYTKVE